jgi:hypothetical protein
MTLSIPINSETESRLRLLAEESGVDLLTFVSKLVERAAAGSFDEPLLNTEEFDQALDQLFAADREPLPESELTYSRNDIYHDRD